MTGKHYRAEYLRVTVFPWIKRSSYIFKFWVKSWNGRFALNGATAERDCRSEHWLNKFFSKPCSCQLIIDKQHNKQQPTATYSLINTPPRFSPVLPGFHGALCWGDPTAVLPAREHPPLPGVCGLPEERQCRSRWSHCCCRGPSRLSVRWQWKAALLSH